MRKNNIILSCLLLGLGLAIGGHSLSASELDDAYIAHCFGTYMKTGKCQEDTCELRCIDTSMDLGCQTACLPKDCLSIDSEECPLTFCSLMENCSGETICHYQMVGGQPPCGDLSYGGQDVACCAGLVRRCGVEFLDGSCDMEGRNSIYNIPICVPCGDGKCTQFENRCNCPEDCSAGVYQGVKFDQEAELEKKKKKALIKSYKPTDT